MNIQYFFQSSLLTPKNESISPHTYTHIPTHTYLHTHRTMDALVHKIGSELKKDIQKFDPHMYRVIYCRGCFPEHRPQMRAKHAMRLIGQQSTHSLSSTIFDRSKRCCIIIRARIFQSSTWSGEIGISYIYEEHPSDDIYTLFKHVCEVGSCNSVMNCSVNIPACIEMYRYGYARDRGYARPLCKSSSV